MESATATLQPERSGEAPAAPRAARREEPFAFPVTHIETIGIFVAFTILYTVVGFWLVSDLHVVTFDALDRLTRAFMVWHNDPPKMAAIGFALPPIGTIVLIPFAVVREAVTSGLALPLSSALLGAAALTCVNRMFAAADMARAARLTIVLLVGLNPMFAFYSMNGTGDVAALFFAGFGLFCLIAWSRNESARYLIGAGLGFALASMTRYEFLIWAFFVAFVVAWTLSDRGRDRDEIRGSTLAYFAPVAYGFGLWVFFNALVVGDPFSWVTLAGDAAPVDAASSASPDFSLADAIGNALRIELIFPATLLAGVALLFNVGRSRDTVGLGLVGLIVITIAYSVVSAAIEGSIDVIELRDALPGLIVGVAAVAYLYLKADGMRPMVWGGMVVVGIVALPLAWAQMKDYPHQDLEQAFTRAISTGEDQSGTSSRGGYTVGVAQEQALANFIDDLDPGNNEILTDNARTYGVIALSGRPEWFFDRVVEGDEEWQRTLEDPFGQVDLMLVERSSSDLILEQYPGADEGQVPFLEPIASNDRYALLRVVDTGSTTDQSSGTALPGTSGGGTTTVPETSQPQG